MNTNRREFIGTGLKVAVVGSIVGLGVLQGCKEPDNDKDDDDKDDKGGDDDGQEVSPPEDLMQEHGVLNRVLLIYDNLRGQLVDKKTINNDALLGAANIIRTFVEDYHEKQEENYLFPRFQKSNQLTDLVQVLLQQHNAGRVITDQLIQLGKVIKRTPGEDEKLAKLLGDFNRMYRPHEAREDTVLFPAFRKIVSRNEYDSLGEEFEQNEQRLFGKGGFEMMVGKVAGIEQSLGIYELGQFTPVNSTM